MKTRSQAIEEIAFTMIPLVGPVIGRQLLSACGDVAAVFAEQKRLLKSIPGIGEEIAANILRARQYLDRAEEEWERLQHHFIRHVFCTDPDYPARLRQLPDAPLILFSRGNVNLAPERTVGIIGTRKPSPLGRSLTEGLVDALAGYDVTVISGLAYGIDITAHKRSLEAGVPTVGVMGSGMGTIYPDIHRPVAHRMMENGGLLTEFPFDTGPDAVNFPMRNRIVAGLSDALVVVESGVKGGSMITAALANDYNKDVLAFPGRPGEAVTAGCNALIKRQMAHLIESGEDLIDLMGWNRRSRRQAYQTDLFAGLADGEREIYRLIVEGREKDIDTLAYESKRTPGELAAILLQLECKGAIKSLPGKKYAAIV